MVRLAIVRHGKAEHDSPSGLDHDRPLKPRGVRQADHLARYFAEQADLRPALIIHSGLERAQHTARVIADALGLTPEQHAHITPDDPPSAVIDLITANARRGPIVIVGHNPQLGAVISILTSGLCGHDAVLKTGEAVVLDVNLRQPIGSAKLVDRVRLEESRATTERCAR